MLSWFAEITVRRSNSMFHDYHWTVLPSCLLLCFVILLSRMHWRHEISDDRIERNLPSHSLLIGFHDPSGLSVQVPYHFSSDPAPRKTNDREGICEHNLATVCELYSHLSSFPFAPHSMSLYFDMKMILSSKCSGLHWKSLIRLWIFSKRPNVMISGNIFHSN